MRRGEIDAVFCGVEGRIKDFLVVLGEWRFRVSLQDNFLGASKSQIIKKTRFFRGKNRASSINIKKVRLVSLGAVSWTGIPCFPE